MQNVQQIWDRAEYLAEEWRTLDANVETQSETSNAVEEVSFLGTQQ
jgi:hypothetical protein